MALCPRLSTLRLDAQILSSAVSAAAKCLGSGAARSLFLSCGNLWKMVEKCWKMMGQTIIGKLVKT